MGTVDLAAQKGTEDALLSTRLYFCERRGRQAVLERRVPVATIPRLGPPSRHCDHPHREEAIEGVSEETPGIPTDELTKAFKELKVACKEPETTKHHWRDWMSESTWLLIKQRTLLRQAGQLCRSEGQRMQRTIYAALKKDCVVRTAQVG